MASSFVHLHLHTQFSLLDGANQIGPLVQQIKSFNQPAVAMTDHGNMFCVDPFVVSHLSGSALT